MEQIKSFQRGELIYCDILQLADVDWKIAIEGGRLLSLESTNSTWPKIMGVVLEMRPTLKVAKVYIIQLNQTARIPYECLYTIKEKK
jgi:hypothetical protein